jgi:transcriptional regulator with XRE-family HTH domain
MKVKLPFENKLREVRFWKSVRQIDLSIKTGIHFSTLSRIEHGYFDPSPGHKKRIAKALGCYVEEIFPPGETPNEPRTAGKK